MVLSLIVKNAEAQTTVHIRPGPVKGKDAEIGLIVPGTNYGNSQKIGPYAWTQNGILNVVRALLEFDLSGVPANAKISDARLSLYFNNSHPDPNKHNGSNAFWIRRITSVWNENTVTWNNQPSTTTVNQVNVAQSTSDTQNYLNINVKALVQDIRDNTASSGGFMLQLQDETPYANVLLASSDNADSTLWPQLVVTYYTTDSCFILRPDGDQGKDAEIGSILPDNNFGNSQKISPYAWTQNGELNIVRGLMEFDLSNIASNATITDAKLSLYYNNNHPNPTQHNGENAFWIRRIISPWEENQVTWNNQPNTTYTNQVSVPKSTSATQDYPDIDITSLVQDLISNNTSSYGFMLLLQKESPYANVLFGSSDNVDTALRPKMKVCYSTATGINSIADSRMHVKIYPNPFSSSTTVQLSSALQNGELTVFNIRGQQVKTMKNISGQEIKFFRDDLSSGIYFMRLTENNKLIVADKFVVN